MFKQLSFTSNFHSTLKNRVLALIILFREVESCGQLLASLGTCLHHLQTLLSWAAPGELFPTDEHSPEELFSQADTINQYCFYGRCLGFQVRVNKREYNNNITAYTSLYLEFVAIS